MSDAITFGQVVRERRMVLGLTQTELARRANCAAITIRKIEADALRPSVQMAELIGLALNVPEEEQGAFVRLAREEQPPSPIPTPTPLPSEIGLADLGGRSVKGFELAEKIGSGGFGVVYRAVQTSIERDVAVKIILPRYANHPNFIRRFEAEARLIACLEHPHIVPLYDYWREPDAAYLIMRLLRGGSLADKLREGPIPLAMVHKYSQQIGGALDVAHRKGVIHRDIKPANVLLDEEVNAYLADFGIAKSLGVVAGQNLADSWTMIGSPAYISPEQILAEPVKPQSDIYLLGLLLFEMLTGHKPLSGSTARQFIEQHLQGNIPSVLEYGPSLPPELDGVIRKATARKVADRYPDVPSLLNALQQALSLTSDGQKRRELSTGELADLDNPYVGLRAFSEADAEHFFGRDTLIQEIFSRLSEETELGRFLAIVGPSGSGKSSVIKAGLVPALRRGGLPGSENWFVLDLIPGTHPWEEVEAALLRVAVNPPETLLNQLQEGERGLIRAVRRILPEDSETELLLIIDQFEEIFTLVEDESVREHFLNSLVTAVLDERSRLRVIITLRADFYDRPLQYVDFGDLLRERAVSVLPMTPDELDQTITLPAAQAGIRLEDGLAATIIRDVGNQPGTLPLLQFVLTELFDQRDRNVMTLAAYQATGGVSGALARRADEIYRTLDNTGQNATRQLFLRLITLGEGVEDTRRRVHASELGGLVIPTEGVALSLDHPMERVIDVYSHYRLLTFDHDPTTRERTVEVAHEALLREWGRLREWLDECREDIRYQRRLTRAAREWEESRHDSSFLIPGGTKLAQFTAWRKDADLALTRSEEDYLQASMAADVEQKRYEAQQAQARRNLRRGLVVVLVAGLIIALGLSVYAFGQQRIANEQRQEALRQASIGLAALAEGELGGINQDRAVLLALEAMEQYPFTPQAAGALALSVESYRAWRVLDQGDSVLALIMVASWSPDGRRIAAGSSPSPNSVIIWDAATGAELLAVDTHGELCEETFNLVRDMAWSPDGRRLAVAAQDAESGAGCGVVVIDTSTGDTLLTLSEDESASRSLEWLPDGSIILTGHEDGQIRLWDTESGRAVGELNGHTGIVYDAAFSGDGSTIVSAGEDGTLRLWDVDTASEQKVLGGHTGSVYSVAWSPDNTRLVSGGHDGLPRIWDVASGETLFVLPGHTDEVLIVTWSEDGQRIASQGLEAVVNVWDAVTGGFIFQIPNTAPEPATKRGFVEFSPDGHWILAGSSRVLGPRIWDASMSVPILFGHELGQEWGEWAPDGSFIATSGHDGSARLWDAATGEQVGEFERGSYWGDWSPDGTRLVFAEGPGNYALNVWDIRSGEKLATLSVPEDGFGVPQFLTMDWSPDGAHIVAAGFRVGTPQPLYIWDAETKELVATLQTDDACMQGWPEWSPDSSLIASGCIFVESGINTPARIWDVANGTELMKLESDYGWTYHTVWSPDGTRILVGYENGVVRIWDVATGEPSLTFSGHQGVAGGRWSPDGGLIASTDYANQVVKIWESQSAEELLSFSLPGAPLNIAWSPDGTHIIVTGDGLREPVIKRVWSTPEELIDYAHDCCVSRQLTLEERDRFGLPPGPPQAETSGP
jgi:WD40 repeat protein/serine/threonine protein kinase/DNA-binding XRE family transcriptional regulator